MSIHQAPAAPLPLPQLSVENDVLQLRNAPQIPDPKLVPKNAQVDVKAYDQLGIAIIAYFFKWLFNKELTVQADNGRWYVVSTNKLENYLRYVDKITHANEAYGLKPNIVKEWLQEVKRKVVLVHLRIQRKCAKAAEEQLRASENASQSMERVFKEHEQPVPKGVDRLLLDYAVVPAAVQQNVEAALREAGGDVTHEAVTALLLQGETNYGPSFEVLDLHNINLAKYPINVKIDALAECFPNVRELNLENCSLGKISFRVVAEKFKQLEKLNVNRNHNLEFVNIPAYSNPFPRLKELSMNGLCFLDRYLGDIPVLASIEKLALQGVIEHDNHFTNPLPLIAERFPNLTHLDLSHSITLRFEHLLELEKLSLLSVLDIRACPDITQEQVDILRRANPDVQILYP